MHQSLAAFWTWVSLLAQPLQTPANMAMADTSWINSITRHLKCINISFVETALPWWKILESKKAADQHMAL
jgi:hypothetical protein